MVDYWGRLGKIELAFCRENANAIFPSYYTYYCCNVVVVDEAAVSMISYEGGEYYRPKWFKLARSTGRHKIGLNFGFRHVGG